MEEMQVVSGGEAGVPHSDYYYGGQSGMDRFINWICRDGARC